MSKELSLMHSNEIEWIFLCLRRSLFRKANKYFQISSFESNWNECRAAAECSAQQRVSSLWQRKRSSNKAQREFLWPPNKACQPNCIEARPQGCQPNQRPQLHMRAYFAVEANQKHVTGFSYEVYIFSNYTKDIIRIDDD